MENLLKNLFFKLGIYEFAKRYFMKPYVKLIGILFNLSAKKAIKTLVEAMSQNNWRYWLEFGTLLGAVRDKGFISHDFDIDIAMCIDDRDERMEQILAARGFKLKKRAKLLSGQIIEETYKYKTATIDIFYAYKLEDQIKIFEFQSFNNLSPDECIKQFGGLRVSEYCLSKFELTKYDFYGLQVWVPDNYHSHLEELYGRSFMIKNKNWSIDSCEVRKLTNHLAVIEHV
ncbi:LicD family protein [Neobacillus niacini]|uniref:LicD family protein n=1 Tax=Neobacillus niacini TaxID=86668 RepID=UPI0005EFF0C0|nr:LicD family protein [Neobacillus niacini]